MIKKSTEGARQKPERQYKALKTAFLTLSSVMILLVSGCGQKEADSEYKKGANAAIEAAEHSLRAQKAVGNAEAIAAAETALSAVKAAAKNDADIRKRGEAINATRDASSAASKLKASYKHVGYYDVEEQANRTTAVIAAKTKAEKERTNASVAEKEYNSNFGINLGPYPLFFAKTEEERMEKQAKQDAFEAQKKAAAEKRDAANKAFSKSHAELEAAQSKAKDEIIAANAAANRAANAAVPAGAYDAIRAADAAEESALSAFDDAATVHTTDAARKHAFIAKQKADEAVAEVNKK